MGAYLKEEEVRYIKRHEGEHRRKPASIPHKSAITKKKWWKSLCLAPKWRMSLDYVFISC